MGKRGSFRRGQGEARTTLLTFELIAVIVVLVSLFLMIRDKQILLTHTDLDQELTRDATHALPQGMTIEEVPAIRSDAEPLFDGEHNG